MLEVFIEFLDQLYHSGYGQEFREENPEEFYRQLTQFTTLYHSKNEIRNPIYHGSGSSLRRSYQYRKDRQRNRKPVNNQHDRYGKCQHTGNRNFIVEDQKSECEPAKTLMKKHFLHLTIFVEVESKFNNLSDTIQEFERNTVYSLSSTENVRVLATDLLKTQKVNPLKP